MQKYFQQIKTLPYWMHLLVDSLVTQGIWWGLTIVIQAPLLVKSIFAGLILVATIFAVAWYIPKWSSKQKPDTTKQLIEFYPNRRALDQARHPLEGELSLATVKQVWIMCWTGHRITDTYILKRYKDKITKLVLQHPEAEYLKYESHNTDESWDTYKNDIFKNTEIALDLSDKGANIEVY
jgi:hypothetical protein